MPRKYVKKAQKNVKQAMGKFKKGELKSGGSGTRKTVAKKTTTTKRSATKKVGNVGTEKRTKTSTGKRR